MRIANDLSEAGPWKYYRIRKGNPTAMLVRQGNFGTSGSVYVEFCSTNPADVGAEWHGLITGATAKRTDPLNVPDAGYIRAKVSAGTGVAVDVDLIGVSLDPTPITP